ncbi:NAD(P)/FAD-dependent oxidoreductase [Candidatus Magnetominusculus xianensis]|uniref:Thioredoxin reductase n=1 Tax=Candidatus Magnetominusculus xianensis TaxID=1748249 RepID=A0ABR5SC23_9BACT|nr:FAD-dependent oxidoreductase [Candidatus Magnetominusculus xianensis]KWT78341.1 thioredoxin reductase [Candidatus Magnetominusculus xianensis]MBF0402879.1 FAD-dependent oxidoreductase [Nitrospirota bacterium]
MEGQQLYDVVIVGGGPAGLTAAQYAARLNLKTVVLDKSKTAGALAFTSKIENYPGITNPMTGPELLDIFRTQAITFGAEFIETQVIGVNIESDPKEIYTIDKTYYGKTVIVATGSMGRKPAIAGEKELLGKGVSYCAICDAAFYRNKNVCILGDSEEAVKEADVLARFTGKVTLIAQSTKLKISDNHSLSEKVNVLLNHRVTEIRGAECVESIVVQNNETKTDTVMPMDGVFVYLHGNRPIVDYLNFSVDISDEECVMTNRMMETNVDGVFAAGDVSCTEVRQVVIAAANGCVAALSAEKYINHRKKRKYAWG